MNKVIGLTIKCVRCGKKANIWTGHIKNNTVVAIAGWCWCCREHIKEYITENGYIGEYFKLIDEINTEDWQ